jgi:hypothetical protein
MKLISRAIAITLFLAVCASASYAQKVANYFAGKPGTSTYQGLSFWVTNDKPAQISYRSGANRKESKATYNGKTTYEGKSCFKMTLPGNRVFYVYPLDEKLAVVNAATKEIETFTWESEGPVDGVGTFCPACTHDEMEAMTLMKASYLK